MSTDSREGASAPDALACLRETASAHPEEPLRDVVLRDADGSDVDELAQAKLIAFRGISGEAEIVLEKGAVTRLARSRDLLAAPSQPQPTSSPESFFTLEALVFALKQRGERAGAYLRDAAMSQITSIPALERPMVLEYLLGARPHWEGVLAAGGAPADAGGAADADTRKADVAAQASVKAKRPYVRDEDDAEFVKRLRSRYEIVELDRNDALRGTLSVGGGANGSGALEDSLAPTADLHSIRNAIIPHLDAMKRRSAGTKPTPAPAQTKPTASSSGASRRSRAQEPIILLANSPTALVNMFNVKALLQDGIFIPPEQARSEAGGIPELVVTIQSRSPGAGAEVGSRPGASGAQTPAPGRSAQPSRRILVVDSAEAVNRLGNGPPGSEQDAWSRVIAVFTKGQPWQFKNYRWTEPREVFRHSESCAQARAY